MNQPNEKIIRIVLSPEQAQQLEASGERAFTIIAKAMRTEAPAENGRWCVHLAPCDWTLARDASAVLTGNARAVRPRKLKSESLTTSQDI